MADTKEGREKKARDGEKRQRRHELEAELEAAGDGALRHEEFEDGEDELAEE